MSEPSSRWSVIWAFALVGAATQLLAQVFPLFYVLLAIPAGLVLTLALIRPLRSQVDEPAGVKSA